MSIFNDNLDLFITSYRENALYELRNNGVYAAWKSAQKTLLAELEQIISPEAREMLKKYNEAVTDVQRMEANQIMLCGITISSETQKRFDTSTPEYQAFADKYLNG